MVSFVILLYNIVWVPLEGYPPVNFQGELYVGISSVKVLYGYW